MNKLFLKNLIPLAAILGLASIQAYGQEPKMAALKATEMTAIRTAVLRPVQLSTWTITQDFTGSFESAAKNFDTFSAEFRKQITNQVATAPTSIMVLYEDPTGKSEFRYAVGVQVTTKVAVKEPLKLEQITKPQVVRVTHTGAYATLASVHRTIATSLQAPVAKAKMAAKSETAVMAAPQKTAQWPEIIRLLNDPRKVAPANLRTELIVPVK